MSAVPKFISIIIPVYNEENFIDQTLERVLAADLGQPGWQKEIIVVNDGSTDRTAEKLSAFQDKIKVVHQPINCGKGAAVRAGLSVASGDTILMQDADLEYDPAEFSRLLAPIANGQADVIYGSRFRTQASHPLRFFLWGNKLLTALTNLVSGLHLTDMETGHKVFTRQAADSIRLTENRFGLEPELTIKLAKQGWRFQEIPVSYRGRSRAEGKKIKWKDGLRAVWVIFRLGIFGLILFFRP